MATEPAELRGREPLPPTPECEPGVYCPFTDNGAYHGVCLWHEGPERTCTCDGRTAHQPTTAACEHYWFVMPDDAPLDVDSLVKQVCGKPATGRTEWLGSHGHPDREIAVCDSCRESVGVQNIFQQAERDGTLHELLFREANGD